MDENHKATIETEVGKYNLMGKPAEEFPSTPNNDLKTFNVDALILKEIIESTLFAVSQDELKPSLTGVFFKFSENVFTAVSTDGHRLVKYQVKDLLAQNLKNEIIIPRKFLSYISTQLAEENIELSISNSFVTAKIKKDIITTKIV